MELEAVVELDPEGEALDASKFSLGLDILLLVQTCAQSTRRTARQTAVFSQGLFLH